MAESSGSTSGGVGFLGLLTVLFVALKLTGVIDWAWIWIVAPLWMGFTLLILFLMTIALVATLR